MAIANCSRCGRLYQRPSGLKICAECAQVEEDAYQLVRAYLEEHPGVHLPEVSAETGVDQAVIVRFIRQGRLAVLDDLIEGLVVECERCGGPITSGRHCAACTEAIGTELKASAQSLREGQSPSGRIKHPEDPREKRARDSSSWRHDR